MCDLQEGSPECTPDSDMSIDDVHKKGKEALQSPLYLESEFRIIFSFYCGAGKILYSCMINWRVKNYMSIANEKLHASSACHIRDKIEYYNFFNFLIKWIIDLTNYIFLNRMSIQSHLHVYFPIHYIPDQYFIYNRETRWKIVIKQPRFEKKAVEFPHVWVVCCPWQEVQNVKLMLKIIVLCFSFIFIRGW